MKLKFIPFIAFIPVRKWRGLLIVSGSYLCVTAGRTITNRNVDLVYPLVKCLDTCQRQFDDGHLSFTKILLITEVFITGHKDIIDPIDSLNQCSIACAVPPKVIDCDYFKIRQLMSKTYRHILVKNDFLHGQASKILRHLRV
jgi:hypothetical protein